MKRIITMVLLTLTACLLYSCINDGHNDGNTSAKDDLQVQYFYTYDYLWNTYNHESNYAPYGHYSKITNKDYEGSQGCDFLGIAIKVAHLVEDEEDEINGYSVQEEYMSFNDEANYDSEITEWRLAYYIANDLFEWNKIQKHNNKGYYYEYRYTFSSLSMLLPELKFLPDNMDCNFEEETLEIFKRNYYDLKDKPIYQAENSYGCRKYPIGFYSSGKPIYLYVMRGKNIDGIPDGTIVVTMTPSWFSGAH